MQYCVNVFGSKHRSNVPGNEENSEFPDFADLFFLGIKNVSLLCRIKNVL